MMSSWPFIVPPWHAALRASGGVLCLSLVERSSLGKQPRQRRPAPSATTAGLALQRELVDAARTADDRGVDGSVGDGAATADEHCFSDSDALTGAIGRALAWEHPPG